MKIKETWLYKKLDDFETQGPLSEINCISATLYALINIILIPILALLFSILTIIYSVVCFPFLILKDLYDLYNHIYAKKIYLKELERSKKEKAIILNDIETVLNQYGDKLFKKYNAYHLDNQDIKINDPTIYNFLLNFFNNYNNNYYTLNKNNKEVCDLTRRRSLGDIFLICKYYFPNCTIFDVFKNLLKLSSNNLICYNKCSTINKYVFYTGPMAYTNATDTVEYFKNITMSELIIKLKKDGK